MLQAQTGVHVEEFEMCDLDRMLKDVTPTEVSTKLKDIQNLFQIRWYIDRT
jgi:L-arabinose isomerase